MPFVSNHPAIPSVPSDDQVIWRFMSLEKLLSLLVSSKLHFAQLKSLQQEDPFEGHYTPAHVKLLRELNGNPLALEALVERDLKANNTNEQ